MSTITTLRDETPEQVHRRRVEFYKDRERAQREARTELEADANPPVPMPVVRSLKERLSQRRTPTAWRIVDWQMLGHRVMLSAQFKAGKTTLVINLVRALLDGVPFLDQYEVSPVQVVTLLDFEMAEDEPGQLDDWYRAAEIQHEDGLRIVPLRGRASAFNILDPAVRARWVETLKGTGYLILDCTRPALDAIGLDENHDAGRFFTAFDELLREAGIRDACVVQHMGHQNERARGDSRFQDWPDVIWTLVRETDDPASKRFIKAFGRGVDVAETALSYNPQNHRLALSAGSRADTKATALIPAIVAFVQAAAKPPNHSDIRKAMKEGEGASDGVTRQAIDIAVRKKLLDKAPGLKNSWTYTAAKTPF